MAGDLRRLAEGREPAQHLAGLRARLAGALSSLPLLLRQAGAADGDRVRDLRAALGRADWRRFAQGLAELRRRHPLDLRQILPATPTPERLRLGEAIHRQACAGCHDAPADVSSALPARSLFAQAKTLPPEEFAARLLSGVRGNASTAYQNPFSDIEIGGLIAFYCGTAP